MAPESSPLDINPRWGGPGRYKACGLCDWKSYPPGVLEGRAPCAGCGVTSCEACASPCRGCALLARLRAVCAGVIELDPRDDAGAAAKTFQLVRTMGSRRDVLIAPDRIVVRTIDDPRYFSYYPQAGPAVLGWILRDTGITRLDHPQIAHAVAARTRREIDGRPADEVAWLIPLERGVEIRFRPPPSEGAPSAPRAIPSVGPWALPPPWSPPPPAVVTVLDVDGAGVACPHCGEHRPTYRALGSAFICDACGRSFTHLDLARREPRPR